MKRSVHSYVSFHLSWVQKLTRADGLCSPPGGVRYTEYGELRNRRLIKKAV